jgi:predicted DCC family thiol-disulfide oxidoreductase YuxK
MTTLVYDGDCAFCTSSVNVMRRIGLTADTVIPWQHADLAALGLTAEQCQEAVQYVSSGGGRASGHVAIARLMQDSGSLWRVVGTVMLLPLLSQVAGAVYTLVAANRSRLPGGTPACALPPDQP